jgi:hypothetical protein
MDLTAPLDAQPAIEQKEDEEPENLRKADAEVIVHRDEEPARKLQNVANHEGRDGDPRFGPEDEEPAIPCKEDEKVMERGA